ncbi:glutamate--tRNA ligase [Halobacteriovorax marinus]|uniref:Glutamate--tRNA ligase n=1 Tax=Halobacteriovorax marinus TaxID=97084 RepID=A0A1Y5F7T9_9BACT|nr:glutamate--tRNA ligase [Halobacteriovorax marinus]
MSVRVRFAPSPTGYLHIGGARTALYCYLIAKAQKGSFILRIEDTDLERSKREYELAMIDDLKWCGIDYDEGPDKGGEFGPYRQSERTQTYLDIAKDFVEKGFAYPCFLTTSELEELTAKAESEKKSPHAYHGKYRDLDPAEAKKRVEAGEAHIIRFKNPRKEWSFTDMVRGDVKFPVDMVGDFAIIRSNGMPVYNFCCVIDDHLMKMTHVIRAEEHLNNTVRQLMIYEALGAEPPRFVHCSLLVGEDRQKLSKRHGATSVKQYREQDYLPAALMNYLCLLGWSHPDETDIFDINQMDSIFDLNRFNKSPAFYDITKLKFFNEQYLRALSVEDLATGFEKAIPSEHAYHAKETSWKLDFAELFREKVQLFSDIVPQLGLIFDETIEQTEDVVDVNSWETTPTIRDYVKTRVSEIKASGSENITSEEFKEIMNHLKKELKIKGKPLFMGLRVVLTGKTHGPDLSKAIPLTPISTIEKRLS